MPNVGFYYLDDGSYNIVGMKKTSFHILRVGVAITFLWIGILIFIDPATWGGFLQPWAAGLLLVPLKQAMISAAILDIALGLLMLINFRLWLAALLGSIHLVIVLTVSGINAITVRDIGLLFATLALFINSFPFAKRGKIG